MDATGFLNLFWASNHPVLPQPTALWLALHGVWALVLGCGALLLAGKLARAYRLGLCVVLMLWSLLPGPLSPTYWLGLAFQTPSLTSAVLALLWLVKAFGWPRCAGHDSPRVDCRATLAVTASETSPALASRVLATAGVVLGWVLLLDTLALLPVSVYAWGFSPAALGGVALLTALLWAASGRSGLSRLAASWAGPALMLAVLSLFVLTRLPSGNLWDALIDPWLWLGLQLRWLFSGLRYLRERRSPPATPV